MRRHWRSWLAAALLGLAALGVARAQDVLPVPPLAGTRVIDQTGTLSAAQQQALDAKLAAIETRRGSQVVVLLVPTTLPEDIAAYAQRVADTWKIGRLAVGDGVVVVVATNDRRVRIEVAKTLEGALPDLAARRIITETLTPAFRAGDYAGGLNAAVDRIDAAIGGEGLPEPPQGGANRGTSGFDLGDLVMFMFIGVPVVGAVFSGMFGRRLGSLATAGAAGGIGWWLTASLLAAGGAALVALVLVGVRGVGAGRRGSAGHGPVIWGGGGGGGWSGGGGGGGFSSGGGGDFGGGGASGDW
jgi:uncharacterized protein